MKTATTIAPEQTRRTMTLEEIGWRAVLIDDLRDLYSENITPQAKAQASHAERLLLPYLIAGIEDYMAATGPALPPVTGTLLEQIGALAVAAHVTFVAVADHVTFVAWEKCPLTDDAAYTAAYTAWDKVSTRYGITMAAYRNRAALALPGPVPA